MSPLRPVPIATQPTGDVRTGLRAVPWWAWAVGAAVLLLVIGTVAVVVPSDEGKEITTSTLENTPDDHDPGIHHDDELDHDVDHHDDDLAPGDHDDGRASSPAAHRPGGRCPPAPATGAGTRTTPDACDHDDVDSAGGSGNGPRTRERCR